MVWRREDPEGNESLKIRWELVPYTRGQTLDIGCGGIKPFKHFIGVDNYRDCALFGNPVHPDMVMDADNLSMISDQSMDSVFSSHLLEHIEDFRKALKEWWRVIKPNGYLVLYLPHKDLYPNIGQEGSNPDHKHDFTPQEIVGAMVSVGSWDLVRNENRSEGREYSFFQVYKKLRGTHHAYSHLTPKAKKRAGVVRYGAIGDLLQASSVFAGLKAQGYHVTVHTSPPQDSVIQHDPNVDEIILQGKDQVPNTELCQFWKTLKPKYDKFINLSESVEGSLLALKDRTPFDWTPLARHNYCNKNYLQQTHEMAGVPHKPRVRFYATPEERQWAREFRAKSGADYLIMWALAGSGCHKTWPYVDNVVASLMLHHPKTHVVMVGDAFCKILEAGWENEERVHRTSGEMDIRKTLSLVDVVDCIVGPETGVLNAASCLAIPKLVFLSHSTHENLTRDWENVFPLYAENVTCAGRGENEAPACHQLHYGWDTCTKDFDDNCHDCKAWRTKAPMCGHTQTAVCQAAIKPERVTEILFRLIEEKARKAA